MTSLARRVLTSSVRRASGLKWSQVAAPVQDPAQDEKCIVVDEKDNALGFATKRDCHRVQENGDLILHRAFSVFIFNTKGEILLQKRSPRKITFPDHVTNACCSHPLFDVANERNEENAIGIKLAARRRLNFELGIPAEQISVDDYDYITRIHYRSTGDNVWGEHEIDYILFLQKDLDLYPNPDEVSDVRYVAKNDFDRFMSNLKSPVTPWFKLIVDNYLRDWWSSLDDMHKFKDHINIQKY